MKWFKKIVYITLLLMIILFCTGCTERKEQQLKYREKGIAQMQEGNYEDALAAFQNALDLSLGEVGETELDICFYKAETLFYLGDVQGAIDTYSAIIDLNENPKAYFLRGNLYYHQNDEEKALKDYEAAIAQDKKNYDVETGVVGRCTFALSESRTMLEKAICKASQLTTLRIGDYVAVELAPITQLADRSAGEFNVKGTFCENEIFGFKIIF